MLTIMPINFTGIRNLPQAGNINNLKSVGLQKDTFQKNISFKGSISFETWMLQHDLTFKDIQNIIADRKNLIGSGNSHSAIAIPNCDDYCLRLTNWDLKSIEGADFSKAKIENTKDVTLKANIGQEVAKIYIERDIPIPYEIQVLRKQEGESIGVQPPETLICGEYNSQTRQGVAPYEDFSRKEKYARTMHKLSQLPIESFEQLIKDYKEAQGAGYSFDYLNSNNLLVDENNKKINLIDMSKGAPTDISGLFYALVNAQYYRTFTSTEYNVIDEKSRMQTTSEVVQIIRKFVQAMKNQGETFDRWSAPYEASKDLYSGLPMWLALGVTNESDVWNRLERMGIAKQ